MLESDNIATALLANDLGAERFKSKATSIRASDKATSVLMINLYYMIDKQRVLGYHNKKQTGQLPFLYSTIRDIMAMTAAVMWQPAVQFPVLSHPSFVNAVIYFVWYIESGI